MLTLDPNYVIRPSLHHDFDAIKKLYITVAEQSDGLARLPHEITDAYIQEKLDKAIEQNLGFVVVYQNKTIAAEIHASRGPIKALAHVIHDLTLVVDPEHQNKKLGTTLFKHLLAHIQQNFPKVSKIEIAARASNERAIHVYKKIGFEIEGIFKKRIRNKEGILVDDIMMGWFNPSFKE